MAEVNNLNFEDGFRQLTINNDPDRVIRWNPSDVNFVDRFLAFQDWVENDLYVKLGELKVSETKSFEDYNKGDMTKLGNMLCSKLDDTFGVGVSKAAFAGVNPISPMINGNLLFINFIEALTPIIENSIKQFDDERRKYTEAARKVGE